MKKTVFRIKPTASEFKKFMLREEMESYENYFRNWENFKVTCPDDLRNRLTAYKWETQEHVLVFALDSANHLLTLTDVLIGNVNNVNIDMRSIFRQAIKDNAVSIIVAHNHPSGNGEPSSEDMAITRVMVSSGKIIGIPVLDHIIVSHAGITSIRRHNPKLFS